MCPEGKTLSPVAAGLKLLRIKYRTSSCNWPNYKSQLNSQPPRVSTVGEVGGPLIRKEGDLIGWGWDVWEDPDETGDVETSFLMKPFFCQWKMPLHPHGSGFPTLQGHGPFHALLPRLDPELPGKMVAASPEAVGRKDHVDSPPDPLLHTSRLLDSIVVQYLSCVRIFGKL